MLMSKTEQNIYDYYNIELSELSRELKKIQDDQDKINELIQNINKFNNEIPKRVLLNRRLAKGATNAFWFNPGCAALNTVLMALIVKSMGFTGLATLGALASAAALGSVFSMPLAIMWGMFGPINKNKDVSRWDLKILLLDYTVAAAISMLGLVIGSLILGTKMSPSLFIGLAVTASIGIFLTILAVKIAKSSLTPANEQKLEITKKDIEDFIEKINTENLKPKEDNYIHLNSRNTIALPTNI